MPPAFAGTVIGLAIRPLTMHCGSWLPGRMTFRARLGCTSAVLHPLVLAGASLRGAGLCSGLVGLGCDSGAVLRGIWHGYVSRWGVALANRHRHPGCEVRLVVPMTYLIVRVISAERRDSLVCYRL